MKGDMMATRYRLILGLFCVSLLVLIGTAVATDPPHNDPEVIFCDSCHIPHSSPGSNLTTDASNDNLCRSCHNPGGAASNWPFNLADRAVPGTSGTSHNWSGTMPGTSAPGNAYGLRATADLSNATLKTMLANFNNVVTCSVCHDQHSASKSPWDPFSFGSWPGGDSGAASAAGSTTTVVTTKSWAANQWQGFYVTMTGGTSANIGQTRLITSNTATTLTVAALPTATALNDTFTINGGAAGTTGSGTTATSIVDSNASRWPANAWTNYYVRFVNGPAAGQERQISGSSTNTLTVTTAFSPAPTAGGGDSYYITNNITSKDFGTATGGTTSAVVQTGKTWTINQWTGYYVKMTGGLNNGLERRIASNTQTQLNLAAVFPNAVANGDTYYIKSNRHFMRVNNALNEACADCHYFRTPDSKPGGVSQTDVRTYDGNKKSHPVGKTLGQVSDPTQFLTTGYEPSGVPQVGGRGELNGGADPNVTNNAVMGLDNEINCLSCHGVHYTDSNSTTVDQP